jgi:hypothetical protein
MMGVQESYFTYGQGVEPPINHDIHWRAGLAPDGSETFTPRTVIYDLKGGFGPLKKINALYDPQDDPASQAVWYVQALVFSSTDELLTE